MAPSRDSRREQRDRYDAADLSVPARAHHWAGGRDPPDTNGIAVRSRIGSRPRNW